MLLRIHDLQIDQEELTVAHHLLHTFRRCQQGGIDSPMQIQFSTSFEQFQQHLRMHQGFSTTEGDSTTRTVHHGNLLPDLLHQIIDRIFRTGHLQRQGRTLFHTFATQHTTAVVGDNSIACKRQGMFRTDLHTTLTPDTFFLCIEFLLVVGNALRIVAPDTAKGAPFHEKGDPNAWPVIDAITLNIKDQAHCICSI